MHVIKEKKKKIIKKLQANNYLCFNNAENAQQHMFIFKKNILSVAFYYFFYPSVFPDIKLLSFPLLQMYFHTSPVTELLLSLTFHHLNVLKQKCKYKDLQLQR